jgi:hypothetical protein
VQSFPGPWPLYPLLRYSFPIADIRLLCSILTVQRPAVRTKLQWVKTTQSKGLCVDREIVWLDLKANHFAHQTFTDLAALDRAIHNVVTKLNAERNRDPLDNSRISA